MKRVLLIVALVLVCLVGLGSFLWWKTYRRLPEGSIFVRGGESMDISLAGNVPHFSQKDPRWFRDRIGGSREFIEHVGCTLCSLAMASTALGFETNPADLNQSLIESGGYTERGWLIWGSVVPATEGNVEVVYCDEPSHQRMDECLRRGEFSLVKFYLPLGIPHWVVVVGKEGKEYLVLDPAQKEREVVTLSSRTKFLYAQRYARRKA